MSRLPAVFATVCLVALLVPAAPVRAASGSDDAKVIAAAWDSLDAHEAAGRWTAAERVLADVVAKIEHAPRTDSLALATAFLRQAQLARNQRKLRDGSAVEAIERSIALAERLRPAQPLLVCRSLSFAALLYIDLAQGDTALARVRRAFVAADRMVPRSDSVVGSLHFREGQAHRVRGDHAAAIPPLRRTYDLTLRRLGPDAPGLGLVRSEIGRAYTQLGEYDSARVQQEEALRIAERNSATSTLAVEQALASLLTLERRAGNPARAVEFGTRAYDLYVARRGESGPEGSLHLANLAAAYAALGDFPRVRSLMEAVNAREAGNRPATHPDLLHNRVTLAMAYLRTGDPAAARAQLDRADSLNAAGPRDRTVGAYSATVRTGLDLEEGRFAEARQALVEAARSAPVLMSSRLDLAARLYETVRGPADAGFADSLGREVGALADSTNVERAKNWTSLLVLRAYAEARLGRREAAWAHALEAEAIARERFRWEVAALPDRAALLHDEDAADPSLALVDLADPGRPAEVRAAWEAVVQRRGAVRAAVVARRYTPATGDTALANAHARWVSAAGHHARLLVAGAFDDDARDGRARFEASRAAADEAEARYARLAAAGDRVETPSLERVLGRLRPDEALVAFVRTQPDFTGGLLSAFVAHGDGTGPRLVRLGSEDQLSARVGEWLATLTSPPPPDARGARAAETRARAAGEAVRRSVWDPLAAATGDARDVRVVAAGVLRDLPWLALPQSGGHYLAEGGVRVHVLLAERDLLEPERSPRAEGLLAVGDPDFDGGQAGASAGSTRLRRLPGDCGRTDVRLGALPGAREEARATATRWTGREGRGPAQLLLGADATEARFKELARGRRAIHVATHGILTRDSCSRAALATRGVGGVSDLAKPAPRRRPAAVAPAAPRPAAVPGGASPWIGRDAWLAFAGANRVRAEAADENEGWLTADEVVTLDLRGTERVVLSACQSGVVDRWSQDAVLGMRRAFHLAGAKCVLASLWPIADESTRTWMDAFYASDSPSAGGALQDASRAVIAGRRTAGLAPHPFYWAAFTATGD